MNHITLFEWIAFILANSTILFALIYQSIQLFKKNQKPNHYHVPILSVLSCISMIISPVILIIIPIVYILLYLTDKPDDVEPTESIDNH